MKKICFVMTDAISFNCLCRDQLEFFITNKDIDITLICGGSIEEIEKLKNRNVGKFFYIPFVRKINFFKDILALLKLFFFLIFNRFDLIVYSTPKALLLTSIASFFSFQRNKVAVVQGRVYENDIGLKKIFFQILDKLTFFFSNKVIFVSNSVMEKTIKENLLSSNKAILIGNGSFNGVNIKKFYPVDYKNKILLRKKWSISEYDFVMCTVGRICKDKGIVELKDIIEKSNSSNNMFIVVGKIEDSLSQNIINELQSRPNFLYVDYTLDIHEIFQLSDLHLFLSHREGFGNVAIEAAACGIPSFSYDIVGIKDSIKENISGQRFKFQETEKIVQSIEKLKHSSFNSYSESALWAKQNFQQEKVWENYLNVYLNIINVGRNYD